MSQGTQLTENEVIVAKSLAARRIIVENINARAKQFRVIQDVMPLDLAPYASQIFRVCFFLINFEAPLSPPRGDADWWQPPDNSKENDSDNFES